MENEVFADMALSRFLQVGKALDPLLPTDPASVHVLLRLLQVSNGVSREAYSSLDLLRQETNISQEECLNILWHLKSNNLVEDDGQYAFRLTEAGEMRALNVADLRQKSLEDNAISASFPGLKYSLHQKPDVSGPQSSHPDPEIRARSNALLAEARRKQPRSYMPAIMSVFRFAHARRWQIGLLTSAVAALAYFFSNGDEVGHWIQVEGYYPTEIYIYPNHQASIDDLQCSWDNYGNAISVTCQRGRGMPNWRVALTLSDDGRRLTMGGTHYTKTSSF